MLNSLNDIRDAYILSLVKPETTVFVVSGVTQENAKLKVDLLKYINDTGNILDLRLVALEGVSASHESKIATLEEDIKTLQGNVAWLSESDAQLFNLFPLVRDNEAAIGMVNNKAIENAENIQNAFRSIYGVESYIDSDLGSYLKLTVNNKTFEVEAQLIAKNGNILSTQTIDLPLESVVIGGYYDDEDKTVALKLQHGGVVTFPIGDLVDGLLSSSEKGQPNGVASLDENGKVPAEQLPESIGGGLPEGFNPEDYVKFTDYATAHKAGIIKTATSYGLTMNYAGDGIASIHPADKDTIKAKNGVKGHTNPIVPENLDYAVKVGITTNTETLTDEEKTSACDWLGAVKVQNPEFDGGATRGYVYFIDTDGNQVVKKVQIQSNADTIPLRNPTGTFYVGTPILPYECVNKGYVDNALTILEGEVEITIPGTSVEIYAANVPAYRKNDPFAYIGAVCVDDSNHLIIGFSKSNNTFIVRDIETGETFKCESWNINE